jgi:hypothetical protein
MNDKLILKNNLSKSQKIEFKKMFDEFYKTDRTLQLNDKDELVFHLLND